LAALSDTKPAISTNRKGKQGMVFNGFTLLIMMISLLVGFLGGVRYENNYMRERFRNFADGETIEQQMKRDGWRL
jgi:hypothetical protein